MSETLEQIALRLAPRKNGTLESDKYGFVNDAALVAYVSKVVAALGAQEPVAWLFDENGDKYWYESVQPFGRAVYAAPVVPADWQMVPKEHVCGLQGFGALDDVCPACESAAPEYGHPSCNRTTNYPCKWSETPIMETTCRVCGKDFPEWN